MVVLGIVIVRLVAVVVLMFVTACGPLPAEHARTLAPLHEQPTGALVCDGEEVFFRVAVRRDEVQPPRLWCCEEACARSEMACELRQNVCKSGRSMNGSTYNFLPALFADGSNGVMTFCLMLREINEHERTIQKPDSETATHQLKQACVRKDASAATLLTDVRVVRRVVRFELLRVRERRRAVWGIACWGERAEQRVGRARWRRGAGCLGCGFWGRRG